MGKFDGIIICTDLDGTLLRRDKSISDENKNAIEYFKSEGGYFTFVTGRMPFFVTEIYEEVNPNAPFGCINGGGLFDHKTQEYIWTCELPKKATELVKCVDENFPNVGIQVNAFYRTYFCKENETMVRFRKVTGLPNIVANYMDVTEPVAKMLFGIESEDDMTKIIKMLNEHPLASEFDFIRSERTLYEILPKGIGKGTSIQKLAEYLNTDINKTIAVGDYNNDISMFRAAKVGIAVANACPDALKAADYVTVSNEENAIAKIIDDLDNGMYLFS